MCKLFSSSLLLFLLCFADSCHQKGRSGNDNDTTATAGTDTIHQAPADTVSFSKTYSNRHYAITTHLPTSWTTVEKQDVAGNGMAINILPSDSKATTNAPLSVHADPQFSFVSIWPEGFGTEFPPGAFHSFQEEKISFQLSFAVNKKESKVFLLKDGTPWAYFIKPAQPPGNWTRAGFLFAQINVLHYKATCYDKQTGKQKELSQCDPLTGDHFVREGTIDKNEAAIIRQILSGIHFIKGAQKEEATDLIQIETPQPDASVQSPVTIKGRARGAWYFEGRFPVKLTDEQGRLLPSGSAEAKGEWMTENFVPFTATLTFDAPAKRTGKLVFEKANPSGLKENEQTYSIPVAISPKK